MLSVVCVYNDASVLAARLLPSLESQMRKVEVIAIDNRDGHFSQAAAALNAGAALAKGDWIVFAHQDIALLSNRWTEHVEQRLDSCPDIGWAGVAGLTARGRMVGLILGMAGVRGRGLHWNARSPDPGRVCADSSAAVGTVLR